MYFSVFISYDTLQSELQEMTYAISAGLQAGFLSPVVGHEYQLSQASDAHRDIMEGKGAKGAKEKKKPGKIFDCPMSSVYNGRNS